MAIDKDTALDQLRLEDVTAPIDGDRPTGIALDLSSFSSPLHIIKSLRDDAENAEKDLYAWRVGTISDEDHEREWKPAAWWPVLEPSIQLLSTQSKDLRAAAWLGEALIRAYGVAGLRKALEICMRLCDQFWDDLHPQPDEEDGHTNATSALRRMFGDLGVAALGEIVFVYADAEPPNVPARQVTFEQFRFAGDFDKITDETVRAERERRLGWISTAECREIANKTPLPFLHSCLADLTESVELVYKLGAFLRDNCQSTRYQESTAPESEILKFRQRVEWMCDTVREIVEQRGGIPVEANGAEQQGEGSAPQATVAGGVGSVAITALAASNPATREEAFRRIEEIADYFEKQEPHSPVHFGLRQIVRWGRMSFPELLGELLEDESMMEGLRKRVGIPKPE